MKFNIIAEHFELPTYLRDEVELAFNSLGGLVDRATTAQLKFKKRPDSGFDGILNLHVGRDEIVYQASNDKFLSLVQDLRAHARHELGDRKEKRVHQRKRTSKTETV